MASQRDAFSAYVGARGVITQAATITPMISATIPTHVLATFHHTNRVRTFYARSFLRRRNPEIFGMPFSTGSVLEQRDDLENDDSPAKQ